MSEVLACIITYNPDLDLLAKNLISIINDVDHVLIVDNHSENFEQMRMDLASHKVLFIDNKENIGIAAALNQGMNVAVEKNIKYILTMDQDSFFEKGDLLKLKDRIEQTDNTVAMIGPTMSDLSSKFVESFDQEINEVKTIITSGALCRTQALKKVGGWEEKLFIDKVDFDICYKLLLRKYKIIKIGNIFLNHNLGESSKKKFLINFLITNHSALRVYYQFRNTIYLQKKYSRYFFMDMFRLFLSDLKKTIGILLFEQDKTKKVIYILSGIFDGIFNNYGKKK